MGIFDKILKNKKNEKPKFDAQKAENSQFKSQLLINEYKQEYANLKKEYDKKLDEYNSCSDPMQCKIIASEGQTIMSKMKAAEANLRRAQKSYDNAVKIENAARMSDAVDRNKENDTMSAKEIEQAGQDVINKVKEYERESNESSSVLDMVTDKLIENPYETESNYDAFQVAAAERASAKDTRYIGNGEEKDSNSYSTFAEEAARRKIETEKDD